MESTAQPSFGVIWTTKIKQFIFQKWVHITKMDVLNATSKPSVILREPSSSMQLYHGQQKMNSTCRRLPFPTQSTYGIIYLDWTDFHQKKSGLGANSSTTIMLDAFIHGVAHHTCLIQSYKMERNSPNGVQEVDKENFWGIRQNTLQM